ncbi:MAG TPA: GNAT family N-acetyltransferase [Saprospiraceae bacterium]|nr:GNAT family N-acetyltransferase [Saprospiraceae bacterium]
MNLEIKHIKGTEDLILIRSIAHQTWPHTFAEILSKDQIGYMLELLYSIPSLEQQVSEKGHKFLIAYENEEAIGFASYEANSNGSNSTKIHKIYFLPSTQGKGYGRQMMDYIKSLALKLKQTSLILNVNKYNKAIQFYEYLGFHIIKQEVIDIGSGYIMDDFVMEFSL